MTKENLKTVVYFLGVIALPFLVIFGIENNNNYILFFALALFLVGVFFADETIDYDW